MKRLSLFVLLVVLVTSACKKEETALSYPSSYEENQYHNTTPVRMYTQRGEVKDENLIKTFIRNYDNYNWYQQKGISENLTSGDAVVLQSAQQARFMMGGSPFEYDLQVIGNELMFTSKEELTASYGQNDEFAINMLVAISKQKPLMYDKDATTFQSFTTYSYKTKERAYAYHKNNTLEFPRLLYTIKTGEKDFQMATRFIDNEFDPSVLATLREYDTLVVQEFVKVWRKK